MKVDNPSELPDAAVRENLMEPYVKCALDPIPSVVRMTPGR